MLAAAGLSSTWLFRKARVLAIFDDLDTVLLMIALKMLIVDLVWQSSPAGWPNVFGRSFTAAGEPLSDPFQVSFSYSHQWDPVIAACSGGSILVAWTARPQTTSGATVFSKRLSIDGQTLSPLLPVSEGHAEAVSADSHGNALILWSAGDGFYGRHFSTLNQPAGGKFRVNPQPIVYPHYIALCGDLAGNYSSRPADSRAPVCPSVRTSSSPAVQPGLSRAHR